MSDKRRTFISFVLGMLVGGALAGAGAHYYFVRCGKHFPRMEWGEARKKEFMGEMKKRLNLSPEQEEKIQKIMDSKKKAMEDLRGKIRPDFHKIREDARSQIRLVLSDRQKPLFEEIVAERKKFWEEKTGPK
jgi:Spy/CpxP family protein refolding chaperone